MSNCFEIELNYSEQKIKTNIERDLEKDLEFLNDTQIKILKLIAYGGFLRKTKINEIPQLINILIGNMSIIGPRPLVKKGYDLYSEDVKECISQMTPGLSGIGSVIFRDEEFYLSQAKDPVEFSKQYIQHHKGELEKWYFNNRSLYVDFMIIFLTIWVIIFPKSDLVYKVFPSLPQLNEEIFKL